MSTEYSDQKIREILSKVNGQNKLAEQAILTLAQRDPQFLLSLVQPYLNGIVLHGIERANKSGKSSGSTGLKTAAQATPLPRKTATTKPAAQPVSGNTMNNLMKALAKGFEDTPPQPSDKKVSQSHIDALQAMIKPKKY